VFLTPFVALFEAGPLAPKLGSLFAGLALLGVYRRTTASFFGRGKALWFTALLAIDPVLVTTTGTGFAENFLTLVFVGTIAAILKSLERPKWILVAGGAAALAYLTKSSVGPFFLIAGLAGLAWRFRFHGWSALRNRPYLGAMGIFGGLACAWALRNIGWFWDGTLGGLPAAAQTSEWFGRAMGAALTQFGDYLWILGARLPSCVGVFLLVAGPWWRELRSLPYRTDEVSSALGLAAVLTYVLAWLISGMLWVLERSPIFWVDMTRFVVIANPVVWWMAANGAATLGSASFRRRFVAAALVLIVLNAAAFLSPQAGVFDAYQDLRERTRMGDVVALDRIPKYEAAIHLARTGIVLQPYAEGIKADYVLTTNMIRVYAGFRLLETFGAENDTAVMPSFSAALWARAE